uniref:Scaffold protein Nfu/NifU N-terminal domain-containing protein n=1 Tax=Arcella intermedia TaxID=1963864 RepID=A0A6B2LHQ6_9EUKA|eukprot:TRINITY_DN10368_c0_g1_i2.p1 TRINITY_DN10368_c0_g1~~TRINITY_DN10368_c0_g1_i2.p1  ORF type:complete len:222 (-),score=34.81 TRINITY_DN10368_c0_g1_i2:35-700(-)
MDEPTPNPDSLKFLPDGLQFGLPPSSTYDYPNARSALNSPLAKLLFQQFGVKRVFLANDFITITKDEMVEWDNLRPVITGTLMEFFSSGLPAVSQESVNKDTEIKDTDSEEVAMIKELFETRIRPAIQSDGGDVTYLGFQDGVVFVKLSGSCSGCPSSSVTLKSGIERLLMHWVPDVKGVMEVESEDEYQKVIGEAQGQTLKEISDQQLQELEQTLQANKQ